MKINNIEEITTVIISAQLVMYGFGAMFIRQQGEDILVGWSAIEEGGSVLEDDEKVYPGLNINDLLQKFRNIEASVEPDPCEYLNWGVQFGDKEACLVDSVCGNEEGDINRELLEKMLECIEEFLEDEEPLGPLRDVATA